MGSNRKSTDWQEVLAMKLEALNRAEEEEQEAERRSKLPICEECGKRFHPGWNEAYLKCSSCRDAEEKERKKHELSREQVIDLFRELGATDNDFQNASKGFWAYKSLKDAIDKPGQTRESIVETWHYLTADWKAATIRHNSLDVPRTLGTGMVDTYDGEAWFGHRDRDKE